MNENEQIAPISLFLGGFGLLFIIFAAIEMAIDLMLPSLIMVLFHAILVFAAFPLFLYALFYGTASRNYYLTVTSMSMLNAVMMFIVAYFDPEIADLFFVASLLEFLPLPVMVYKLSEMLNS